MLSCSLPRNHPNNLAACATTTQPYNFAACATTTPTTLQPAPQPP